MAVPSGSRASISLQTKRSNALSARCPTGHRVAWKRLVSFTGRDGGRELTVVVLRRVVTPACVRPANSEGGVCHAELAGGVARAGCGRGGTGVLPGVVQLLDRPR